LIAITSFKAKYFGNFKFLLDIDRTGLRKSLQEDAHNCLLKNRLLAYSNPSRALVAIIAKISQQITKKERRRSALTRSFCGLQQAKYSAIPRLAF
jgi:hypothetical protein